MRFGRSYPLAAATAAIASLALPASAQAPPELAWTQSQINGHWYGTSGALTGWIEGETTAVRYGGHLATVRSALEQNWIEVAFAQWTPSTGCWLGLNDTASEGAFTWSSGEVLAYTNWSAGQPNDPSGIEDYAAAIPSAVWKWSDEAQVGAARSALVETALAPTSGWTLDAPIAFGSQPSHHEVGDLDGDALPDLVATRRGTGLLYVYRNLGGGVFGSVRTFGTATDSLSLALGDVDHDGILDVAVAGSDSMTLAVHRGDGTGGFLPPITYSTTHRIYGLVCVDMNADDYDDVVVTTAAGGDELLVFLANHAGGLLPPTTYPAGATPYFVSAADLDHDADVDLVVADFGASEVRVFLNQGNGAMTALPAISVSFGSPSRVELADMNGDGDIDIVVPYVGTPAVSVLQGDGLGGFSLGTPLPGVPARWVESADLNGDGLLDIVLPGYGANEVMLLMQDAGGFSRFEHLPVLAQALAVQVTDIDNDGSIDISVTSHDGGYVAVYRNLHTEQLSTFCYGDGALLDHTTPCPCGNSGSTGNGCANSTNPSGANLIATGRAIADTVVLHGSGMPSSSLCVYVQTDALADAVNGDGVVCSGGHLVRLRQKSNVGGASQFPQPGDVSVSTRGNVTPGSGDRRYYHVYYRNAAATFCPPATFNVTNGLVVDW